MGARAGSDSRRHRSNRDSCEPLAGGDRLSEPRPDAPVQAPTASLFGDRVSARLRGFGPVGIAAMLVILLVGNYPVAPLSGILVLVWVGWSRTAWREIGYVRPKSWMRDLAAGIA